MKNALGCIVAATAILLWSVGYAAALLIGLPYEAAKTKYVMIRYYLLYRRP